MKPFDQLTYNDAVALFDKRRSETAKRATLFFEGDHLFPDFSGFIGEIPPKNQQGYAETMSMIAAGFVSENVIGEVVENHVGGILGREPIWAFLSNDGTAKAKVAEQTYAPLTVWWNDRERLLDLQKCAQLILCEDVAIRHIYSPIGRLKSIEGEAGALKIPDVSTGDLPAALDLIYCETVTADMGGVFTHPATQRQIGIFLGEREIEGTEAKEKYAELSYLEDKGATVVRIVFSGKDFNEQDRTSYNLGGRLLVYEVKRKALITEQVQSNQKALNLAHTMMMRNVNLAGNRDTTVTNAQQPGTKKKVADPNSPTGVTEVTEPAPYVKGAGAVMFLIGRPIYNDKNQVAGYTNPNVSISDPVPVDTFLRTRDHFYAAILGQCQQRHKLIAGDATASGASREQARAEYESSLKKTKIALDAAGRWELEAVLRLAAQLSGQTSKYLSLRADFNCTIDAGAPDSETRRVVMEMREPGGVSNKPLISDETARGWIGIDDNEAEVKKIEEQRRTGNTLTLDRIPTFTAMVKDGQMWVDTLWAMMESAGLLPEDFDSIRERRGIIADANDEGTERPDEGDAEDDSRLEDAA